MAAETIFIPVRSAGGGELRLEATLHRPAFAGHGRRQGRSPLVIVNHGSTGGGAVPLTQTNRYEAQAPFFLARGFVMIAPMRKGRGRSEGRYAESEAQSCDFDAWTPGIASALEDLEAVIEHAATLPDVDASRIVLVGMSRGGFVSVAYSARGRAADRVRGVINFVGGWVRDRCPEDFNRASFAAFGAEAKHPMLWLYADNDAYYGQAAVTGYAKAFIDAGGRAELRLYSGLAPDGHYLQDHLDVWQPDAGRFLDALGWPRLVLESTFPPSLFESSP